ncbi:227 kDa spindle and centromere-associated protein-like protein [Gossypium australe]|uniref:227 kDa spindle and centromere-associated protein-like protein n=1 Tax=Gossypium australe TaxID=47621 RepID=A0A5B6X4P8_9ROSI|nr:227 kDa spindle and centromere-associated protein-like protein [Gossypium australe]
MTIVVTPLSGSEKLCFREVFTSAWASGLLSEYIRTYVFVKFSLPHGHREIKLVMESEFLDKVEDNAAIRTWSEQCQIEKGDSLVKGYVSELRGFTNISVTQNELQELKEIWAQWDNETKQLFYGTYGDLPYLLDVKIDKHLFRAMAQFWNAAYSCFSFGKVDLVPTVEEYTTLLRCPRIQVDKAYSKAVNGPTFMKKLTNITGMSEQWVLARMQKKGESKCIPWTCLRDLILAHPDAKKKIDVLPCVYGMIIFPKALRHIDEAVIDLFSRLDKGVTPVPAILAETFRSLNACRRMGEGRFIGCAQLLLAWFHSHFWKVEKGSYRFMTDNYSPLEEIAATPRGEDVSEENWIALFQNLQEGDIGWKVPWLTTDQILYRCGSFDWVPLLGIWGATAYAPLLVLRQYNSRQFVPTTYGLAQGEFSYEGGSYKKRVKEISSAWNQIHRMKKLSVGPMTTSEYREWRTRRINDNIPERKPEGAQSKEEYLRVVPSELEIVKRDFEKMSAELERKIERLEEEKMLLKLDVDGQKAETEKLRKEKEKVEEDRDDLKKEYKKMRLTIRNAGLGTTPEQWRRKIQEEKAKASSWEEKFQEMQTQNEILRKDMAESHKEKKGLKAKVAELGRSLHHYQRRDSEDELKLSLSRIKEMKGKIEGLETTLHGCELRIELLEAREGQWKEELHHSHQQVRDRDYLMGEAIVQIRKVADHLQALASQAEIVSMKYELQADRNQELTSLLRKIKTLSLRAKAYL